MNGRDPIEMLSVAARPDRIAASRPVRTPALAEAVTGVRQAIARGDLQIARRIATAACHSYPDAAHAHHALAATEALLGNSHAAIVNEEQALVRDPGLTEAETNLRQLKERWTHVGTIRARHACETRNTSTMTPADRTALYVAIGRDLMALGEWTTAAALFQKAVSSSDSAVEALLELGGALERSDRLHDAINCYRRAIAAEPRNGMAVGLLVRALQDACLWQELERLQAHRQAVMPTLAGKALVAIERPFASLITSEDPAENRRAAARYAALIRERTADIGVGPVVAAPVGERLRIGYLSSDFRYHPVGQLAAAMLPHHDRDRFEIRAYSIGADDGSSERRTVAQNCDAFCDLGKAGDVAAAEAIAADGVQILVDLNGYTSGSRAGVLALRPAPVQVWALGFPGTSGSDFVDYIVADRTSLPPEHCPHFSEQPCWLPNAGQPLDDRQRPAEKAIARAALGLPEHGMLFVAWQSPFKIGPRVFDLWMEILRAVPDAHLWLRPMPEFARRNLGIEARRRGIEPGRMVFAAEPAADKPGYLRQLSLADLALDTLTYNGHATTSDLLWAGVPVVTMLGGHLAGRIAASLVQAAGLPELVTYSPRAYRDVAVKLALDPERRLALKARLIALHKTAPLFDTGRYVRALERGYAAMWARHRAGEPPAPIAVEPDT